ncbi:hypothetical protein, partial [Pseudomonas sp. MEJ086]
LAIDSSALGGMYAGAIRLVGTEAGVGVKLAGDMAASAGDIQIDASGRLSLNRVVASDDIELAASAIELGGDAYAGRSVAARATQTLSLDKERSLAAGERITLNARQISNQGVIEAAVSVTLPPAMRVAMSRSRPMVCAIGAACWPVAISTWPSAARWTIGRVPLAPRPAPG